MTRNLVSDRGASPWWTEARALGALSVPLMLTNLGQIAIQTTDVVMIGWLGPEALASASLGATMMFALQIFCMGVVLAISAMVAQDLGRRSYAVREPRRTVRQGFWAATALGIPCLLLMAFVGPILRGLGQDPVLVDGARDYVHAAMGGFLPVLWFIGLRSFISSLERPTAGMVIMFVGILVNAVGDYVLIFGALGLPALGLQGAGIATALTNGFLCLGLLLFVLTDRVFRRYHLLGRLWRSDWARFLEVFRIGVPIGATLALEVGLFAAAVYIMGLFGTAELAAHQIALQCAAVTFMVPLGLAQAATVRVGLAAGRRDPAGVLRAGGLALAMGTLFMAVMAAVLLLWPRTIIGFFLDAGNADNAPVFALAVAYLFVAALFQVFDGLQVIAMGALRGLKDTRVPMVIAIFGYWGIGLGTAVILAFWIGLGGLGVWIGMAAGLAAAAVMLVARFYLRPGLTVSRAASAGAVAV